MWYRIEWEIECEADSPEEAARWALERQRDPESHATFFTVYDEVGEPTEIDLEEE